MDAVGTRLYPGAVLCGHILHPQFVGGGQQSRKQRVAAFAQRFCIRTGQRFGVEHNTLNAKLFRSFFGCFGFRSLLCRQTHGGARHGKTLLLQDAHRHGAGGGIGHPHQDLVLTFVGIKPVSGQKCVAHVPCLPPCALLCATASWSQRSFSGWPAWPLTQT